MAQVPRQPGLFEADAPSPAAIARQPVRIAATGMAGQSARRLWLALSLPGLPLAALPDDGAQPRAVLDGTGRGARIRCCDAIASDQGVRAGLSASAALALLPGLRLLRRDPRREQRLLAELAGVAMAFTPCVSIAVPDTLLLEIGGSLRLFGGARHLRSLVLQAFHTRGHVVRWAIAPTARAARWLAHAGAGALVRQRGDLAGSLAGLPVTALPWPEVRRRALVEMGIDTLGDCVRLPRDGLARRLGADLLRELDQAYGRCPEAVDSYRPPQQFDSRVALEQASRDVRQLCGALDLLLARLAEQLQLCQRSVRHVWLRFAHRDGPDTRLRIGLLRATADPARLRELGRVQLAAVALPATVVAVRLQARLDEALSPLSGVLLDQEAVGAEEATAFVERLRARLGEQSVHALQTCAEHRPEYAWRAVQEPAAADARDGVAPASQRPSAGPAGVPRRTATPSRAGTDRDGLVGRRRRAP
jgi:protein ImuB